MTAASPAPNSRCVSVDRGEFHRALTAALTPATGGEADPVVARLERARLFADCAVTLSGEAVAAMLSLVSAVEQVVRTPAYIRHALDTAPAIARTDPVAVGGLLGYDFHLTPAGPRLIEINTNAGGALLCAAQAVASQSCPLPPPARERLTTGPLPAGALADRLASLFREEWRRFGAPRPLETIALVDEDPPHQFLYPEFLLFQRLFQRHGLTAVIVDPRALALCHGGLYLDDGRRVDLVYNRLTDFYLEAPEQAALRGAHERGAALVTPHPRAYALYADKRNLVCLSDAARLDALGVPPAPREVLPGMIPRTRLVAPGDAEELWRERKHLFFKPVTGFGSRAAYRGDKITRRVFEEVLTHPYVAQEIAPPGECAVTVNGEERRLKVDFRLYVHDGEALLLAARLYQGQTTNFRTPGGGFAPVFYPPFPVSPPTPPGAAG